MNWKTWLTQLSQSRDSWGKNAGYHRIALIAVILGGVAALSYLLIAVNSDEGSAEPLALYAIGSKSVNEGDLLQFTVTISDPEESSVVISASNLPEGSTFDSETQTFSWTPTRTQAGIYPNIRFEATNGEEIISEVIAITVNQPYVSPDVNQDGDIDVLDVISIRQRCGDVGTAGWIREDVNEDGSINVLDMIAVGQY